MRLHLVVYRHDFPPVRILWSTPPAFSGQPSAASSFTVGGPCPSALHSARRGSVSTSFNPAHTSFPSRSGSFGPGTHGFTIAQLLQDVNERVPLETQPSGSVSDHDVGHWGLEDYVVEVFGSECLHYMEVESLLRDGDEVVIRPLESDELIARRIAGRHQRAADGTHLIDGVQFGKRYDARLGPSRPSIVIPPRKRRRIDNGGLEDDRSAMSMNYAIDWRERDQEDAPRNRVMTVNTVGQSKQNSVVCPPILEQEHEHKASNVPSLLERQPLDPAMPGSSPTVLHQQLKNEMDFDVPKTAKSTTPMLTSEESGNAEEASDTSSDSSGDESSQEESNSESRGDSSSSAASTVSASGSSASSSSSESSDSESESESNSADDQPKTAAKLTKLNPPGEGSRKTRNSNDRTKMRRKLVKLKELGILHKDANFSELRTWIAAHGDNAVPYISTHVPGETTAGKEQNDSEKKQDLEAGDTEVIPNRGMEVHTSQRKKSQCPETGQSDFEKKRAQLLQDLKNGGVDISSSKNGGAITSSSKKMKLDSAPTTIKGNVSALADTLAEPMSETKVSKKQAKLDMAGARRLLFGSLGVRTPKTKEDEEITRSKLAANAAPPNRIAKEKSPEDAIGPERDVSVLQPVENWQNVLMLKATECIHDKVVLSDPPFPFLQRWNSEDQEAIRACRANSNKTGNRGKKRKRKSRRSDFTYEEDEYEENNNYDYTEGSLLLDYDEPQVSNSLKTPVQRNLVDTTTNPPNEPLEESSTDELPLLPRDLFSRPLADESEIRTGAIIAFKQLDMSKETNWEPVVSDYRTAIVEEVFESSTFRVCLAKRDRARQPIEDEDSYSPRVYSKFEMPGYTEDADEDDGIREVTFQELIDPKLLRPGASTARATVPAVEVEESSAVETRDIIPESIPVNKLPVGIDTPLSSQTRNDISNMIHNAGFRSAIHSDLLIPDVHPGFSEAQLPEEIDKEADTHMFDADANSVASEAPLREGFDEEAENHILDVDANSVASEARQLEGFDEEIETPKLNADNGSPVIGTPTFDGFDESEFPDISIFSRRGKNGATNSSRNSPSPAKETQSSASGNNASSHIAGQRMNPENPLSLNPSDDGLTYFTDDLTLGLCPQDDDAQPRLGVPPKLSPRSFQPEQVSLSDSQEDEEDESQVSTLPETFGDIPLTGCRQGSSASSRGSTVPNPFYYTDRKNACVVPDSTTTLEPFASTAPARITTEKKRKRRKTLSSPRKASTPSRKSSNSPSPSPQPFLSFSDDDDDSGPEPPAEIAAEKKSISPVPSQLSAHSLLKGSQLEPVDLTFSSDPVSPGNSDGDFAATQGLPLGPGWVKKKYPKRERAQSTRQTNTPPARRGRGRGRGRGRRSVI